MSRKDTIENMRSIAKERGGRCLSDEYVDQKTHLLWECAEGHIWSASPDMVKGSRNKPGTWCKICGLRSASEKRMHTLEDMHRLAEQHGGIFLSDEYLGNQVKHLWRCSQYPSHPDFEMTPNAVQQGQWCPKHAGNAKPTLYEINELARTKHPSARCISTVYKNSSTPLVWQCGVGGHGQFEQSYRSVKHDGAWCKLCRQDNPRPRKYDREILVRFAKRVGGTFVSGEDYRSTKQKFKWRCADGHDFLRSLDSILAGRSFCPECAKRRGLREQYIRELFFYMFGVPFLRTRDLPWLINKSGNRMELDGYNADLLLAFEHNGQQHYELDGYLITHQEQLSKRIADDEEKAKLCSANGVALVVIPFSIPLKEIQTYALQELAKISIEPPVTTTVEPGVFAISILERLRKRAAELGGNLLSDRYQGSQEKLLWKCMNPAHQPFWSTPSAILGRTWCPKCATEKQSDSYRVSVEQVKEWAHACNGELALDTLDSRILEKGLTLADEVEFLCLSCDRRQFRKVGEVNEGRLCLCHTNKARIDRMAIEEKLSGGSLCLVGPDEIDGGKTHVTIRCKICKTVWPTKASSVMNAAVGCPKCRPNSSITIEKARELGEKIGFLVQGDEVKGGQEVLRWKCKKCGEILNKSYREMRNRRACPACVKNDAATRLGMH